MSDEENCPVCFYPLNRYWVQNVCLHKIHIHCMKTLLLYGNNCPLCRREVDLGTKEVLYTIDHGNNVPSRLEVEETSPLCQGKRK